jgi:acyl-CoA synthetase (AMP-forming)/AMP-acid ligase II
MLLRGPNVMLGYWQLPDGVSGLENGWYRSGDQVRLEADGNVWFVSRLKDLMVCGGSNVAPAEVERAILAHPAVRDAGVVGVPDPVLGQRVVGFVQLAEVGDDVLPDIRRSLSAQLADYKLPDRLFRIDAIPRTPVGKVDRQRLLALAADWL